MIIVRTPFRVSLFGGGTDYPAWFRENGGMVIAMAVNKYGYLMLHAPDAIFHKSYKLRYMINEDVDDIANIDHPSIRECLKFMGNPDCLDVCYSSDLPSMSGMGSSSSFTVGLLTGLQAMASKESFNIRNLADTAIYIEQNRIGEAVGCQDQIIVAYGGFRYIKFLEDDELLYSLPQWDIETIDITKETSRLIENNIFLVYTGIYRKASDLASKQIESISKTKEELEAMMAITYDVYCLLTNDPDTYELEKYIGENLDKIWNIKRTLTPYISSPDIDNLYEYGRRNGATGGKLLGAGGGGFFLFWVPGYNHNIFEKAFRDKSFIKIKIAEQGTTIVYNDTEIKG